MASNLICRIWLNSFCSGRIDLRTLSERACREHSELSGLCTMLFVRFSWLTDQPKSTVAYGSLRSGLIGLRVEVGHATFFFSLLFSIGLPVAVYVPMHRGP